MDINNGYDRHLDPPDTDEAEYCEYCNQEHEYDLDGDARCDNPFCPEKWTNEIVHNMAERLVEVEQELLDLKVKFKMLNNSYANAVQSLRYLKEKEN